MRLNEISTIEAANSFVPAFNADFNARFGKEQRNPKEPASPARRVRESRRRHVPERGAHAVADADSGAFVKRGKTGAADAEAISEAATWSMLLGNAAY